MTGKIIYIDRNSETGGWGFISSKELTYTRIFFHWTALKQETTNFKDLKTGDEVTFDAKEVPIKGWRAVNIVVAPELVTDDLNEFMK